MVDLERVYHIETGDLFPRAEIGWVFVRGFFSGGFRRGKLRLPFEQAVSRPSPADVNTLTCHYPRPYYTMRRSSLGYRPVNYLP